MAEILARLGYGDWFTPDAHLPLMDALRRHFPREQIVFSQEGFNELRVKSEE